MTIRLNRRAVGERLLNVAEVGDGPPLVMFHGVTQRWQTFLPLVPALSLRHRLLMVDARGHGESDRGSAYRVVDYLQDARELISQLDGPVRLYGHSLGSMVAAGLAADPGMRIAAAVLEDPPLHAMGDRIGDTYLLNYFKATSQYAGTQRDAGDVADEIAGLEIFDPVSKQSRRLGDVRNAIQRRFSASCWSRLDPAVFQSILAAQWLDGYDVDHVFSAIQCPTLLLQADVPSGGMLTAEDADHVVSLNSSVSRVQFPGIGHTIHTGATQTLLNTVLPFLETMNT